MYRQMDRQMGRQMDRQTDRDRQRETDRQTDRHTDRQTGRERVLKYFIILFTAKTRKPYFMGAREPRGLQNTKFVLWVAANSATCCYFFI